MSWTISILLLLAGQSVSAQTASTVNSSASDFHTRVVVSKWIENQVSDLPSSKSKLMQRLGLKLKDRDRIEFERSLDKLIKLKSEVKIWGALDRLIIAGPSFNFVLRQHPTLANTVVFNERVNVKYDPKNIWSSLERAYSDKSDKQAWLSILWDRAEASADFPLDEYMAGAGAREATFLATSAFNQFTIQEIKDDFSERKTNMEYITNNLFSRSMVEFTREQSAIQCGPDGKSVSGHFRILDSLMSFTFENGTMTLHPCERDGTLVPLTAAQKRKQPRCGWINWSSTGCPPESTSDFLPNAKCDKTKSLEFEFTGVRESREKYLERPMVVWVVRTCKWAGGSQKQCEDQELEKRPLFDFGLQQKGCSECSPDDVFRNAVRFAPDVRTSAKNLVDIGERHQAALIVLSNQLKEASGERKKMLEERLVKLKAAIVRYSQPPEVKPKLDIMTEVKQATLVTAALQECCGKPDCIQAMKENRFDMTPSTGVK